MWTRWVGKHLKKIPSFLSTFWLFSHIFVWKYFLCINQVDWFSATHYLTGNFKCARRQKYSLQTNIDDCWYSKLVLHRPNLLIIHSAEDGRIGEDLQCARAWQAVWLVCKGIWQKARCACSSLLGVQGDSNSLTCAYFLLPLLDNLNAFLAIWEI